MSHDPLEFKLPSLSTTLHVQEALTEAYVENRIVVLYFTGRFCGPCREIKPAVEALAHQFAAQLQFYTIDIGATDIVTHFAVKRIPTFVFLNQGNKIVHVQTGADAHALASSCAEAVKLLPHN